MGEVEWFSIDNPPLKSCRVLLKTDDFIGSGEYEKDDDYDYESFFYFDSPYPNNEKITHWRYLPCL